jgi:hypothetical protein
MFKIEDFNLNIKSAYLYAHQVNDNEDELAFTIKIKTEEKENVFWGNPVCFISECYLKIKPNEIKTWKEIAGKTLEWEDYDEEAEIYIYEFEDVYDGKIEFKNRDNKIIVKVNGIYNDSPLKIETEIIFYGIYCGKNVSKEDCETRIKPFLDVSFFRYVQDKNGGAIMIPKESNLETNLLVLAKY